MHSVYGMGGRRESDLLCVIVAQPNAGEDGDYRVYQAPDTIRFDRHCADAEPHSVEAWAELGSEDGLARALVLAYARHDAVRRDEIFIGPRLTTLRTGGICCRGAARTAVGV